jgi:nicotinamide mononucleotide (NMN) deamidase PncC
MELSKEILGLVSDIHDSLRTRGETLSTAESLTAGGLSNALTIVPGASDVFLGSLTAYRSEIKVSHLGVDESVIAERSVVSEEVAIAMGHGANKSFRFHLGDCNHWSCRTWAIRWLRCWPSFRSLRWPDSSSNRTFALW